MKYAIELNFDKQTEESVTNLWQTLVNNNLAKPQNAKRPFVPHITLAVVEALDEIKYTEYISKVAKSLAPLNLLMVSLGLFRDETNVLFIAPRTTTELLDLNRKIHNQLLLDEIENWHFYNPNRWVAHCSLTTNSSYEQIMEAFLLCNDLKIPFQAKADKLTLVDFKEGRTICVANLNHA